MKKLLVASFAVIAMLAGCATPIQPLTPAQVVANACAVANTGLATVPLLATTTPAQLADLPAMQKKVSAVCAIGATLNGATLQTMVSDALPFFLSAAQAVPNPDPTVKIIIDGITLANVLLPGVIAQLNAAAPIITVATPAK